MTHYLILRKAIYEKKNTIKKIDKPDTAMKTFWRNNERFADLFNAVAFNGRQVINPDELTEMDTDVSGVIQFTDYNESLVRTRDIIKSSTMVLNSPFLD